MKHNAICSLGFEGARPTLGGNHFCAADQFGLTGIDGTGFCGPSLLKSIGLLNAVELETVSKICWCVAGRLEDHILSENSLAVSSR
jgi:hypothetical protein